MRFKLKRLEDKITDHHLKPRGARLLTRTGSQISPGVPCRFKPSSKPRRQAKIESWQCDIGCVCLRARDTGCAWSSTSKRKDKDRNKERIGE